MWKLTDRKEYEKDDAITKKLWMIQAVITFETFTNARMSDA
jgi:hypothetical protein